MVTQVSTAEVWDWLESVPDPEIPVVSVVELGIVREVAWSEDTGDAILVITVTPTYSGCPATEVIAGDIESEIRDHGVNNIRVETQIAPAWRTEWISDTGRQKLKEYGIAPPIEAGRQQPPCPRCNSNDTRRVSEFGSTPCKALFQCESCLEPFDYFKCH